MSERRQQPEIGRPQHAAGRERDLAARQIFAGEPAVVAGADHAGAQQDAVAVELDHLLGHDAVEPGRG